jgi:type II secretory pathway pseudopilin PulG
MRSVIVAVLILGVGLTLTTLEWRSSVAANERALEARFATQTTDLAQSI